MGLDPWILRRPSVRPRLRLHCFSYAGGNAAQFLQWQGLLPPDVEVCAIQLPGRGTRLSEASIRAFPQLIETLAPIVTRESDLPFAFFGHSLGGLLAFELARHCRRARLPMPEHVFVSGCNAPQHLPKGRRLHALDDDALIAALRDYNGTPPAALANRELMDLLLPAIRADFALVESYEYRPDMPLDIPITVLAGTRDKHVASERLCRWQEETTEACALRWFAGDHFFIHSHQAAVLACIQAELADLQNA